MKAISKLFIFILLNFMAGGVALSADVTIMCGIPSLKLHGRRVDNIRYTVDEKERIYIFDRDNNVINIYDSNGIWIDKRDSEGELLISNMLAGNGELYVFPLYDRKYYHYSKSGDLSRVYMYLNPLELCIINGKLINFKSGLEYVNGERVANDLLDKHIKNHKMLLKDGRYLLTNITNGKRNPYEYNGYTFYNRYGVDFKGYVYMRYVKIVWMSEEEKKWKYDDLMVVLNPENMEVVYSFPYTNCCLNSDTACLYSLEYVDDEVKVVKRANYCGK